MILINFLDVTYTFVDLSINNNLNAINNEYIRTTVLFKKFTS